MDKECLRREGAEPFVGQGVAPGRLAEQVRRLPAYRTAKAVFVGPALLLRQVRMNVLGDGKRLFMPSAGLQEGFWSLPPYILPFSALSQAVTPQGIATHGARFDLAALSGMEIGLLVTDAVAVDRRGVMVADGKGFFDLSLAILGAAGALGAPYAVVAVTPRFLGEELVGDPQPWDVRADVVIHPGGVTECATPHDLPPIVWEALSRQRIRRITPLWQLARQQGRRDGLGGGGLDEKGDTLESAPGSSPGREGFDLLDRSGEGG